MKSFMFYIIILMEIISLMFTCIIQDAEAQYDGEAEACPEGMSSKDCIQNRGNIIAGVKYDAKPFGYWDEEEGEVAGFDVDLVRILAKYWPDGEIDVEFIQVTSKDRIEWLQKGYVDLVAATMTSTPERDECPKGYIPDKSKGIECPVDFSDIYFHDGQRLLVRKNSELAKKIRVDDPFDNFAKYLSNKRIAVIANTTSMGNIQKKLDEYNRNRIEKDKISVSFKVLRTYPDAIDALFAEKEDDLVDIVTTDGGILTGLVKDNPGKQLVVVGKPFSKEPYGIGIREGDDEMCNWVNDALKKAIENGELKAIFEHYFPDEGVPPLYEPAPKPASKPAQALSQESSAGESTAVHIERRGKIVAGVKFDSQLFGYGTSSDNVEGFDVDLVRAFAHCWLGDENAVEFVRVTSKDRIRMLQGRQVDLLAATMTHTKNREDIYFSQDYFQAGQRLLVRKDSELGDIGEDTPFSEYVTSLKGKHGAVVQDTTAVENLRKEGNKFHIPVIETTIKETFPSQITISEYRSYDDAVDALLDNEERVDFVTTDDAILEGFVKKYPEILKIVGAPFSEEPYGIGIHSDDHEFKELVDETLQALKKTGEYDTIFTKWFPGKSPYEIRTYPGDMQYYDFSPFACPWLKKHPVKEPRKSDCPSGMKSIQMGDSWFCLDIHEVDNENGTPLVDVTWDDAQTYCKELGKRLPTADEWDFVRDHFHGEIEELNDNIKEWIDKEDDYGKKYYRPFREGRDPTLYPDDEKHFDIGFRCAQ